MVAQWRAAGAIDGFEDRVRQTSISKVEMPVGDPVSACLQYLERHSVDLIVVATEGRSGLSRLLRASRAERLARRSGLMTLFVPEGGRYFVDPTSGAVSLRRILVPVDPSTDPRPAMLRAVQAASLMDDPMVEITLLHVSDEGDVQGMDVPALPFCRWNVVRQSGDIVAGILEAAERSSADAIYMSTAWSRPGLVRAEGGVTEAVLAAAPCPVATVPVLREGSKGSGET
jgi:nucleotide-binding universal stress UspA family protein